MLVETLCLPGSGRYCSLWLWYHRAPKLQNNDLILWLPLKHWSNELLLQQTPNLLAQDRDAVPAVQLKISKINIDIFDFFTTWKLLPLDVHSKSVVLKSLVRYKLWNNNLWSSWDVANFFWIWKLFTCSLKAYIHVSLMPSNRLKFVIKN